MNLRKKLLAVGIAAGLLLVPTASSTLVAHSHAGPVVSQVQNAEAASRAADWLNDQFVDGTHIVSALDGQPDVSTTIDAILGLVAAAAHPETVEAATQWVIAQAPSYVETSSGRAGKAALLAATTGIDPTDFGGLDLVTLMQGDTTSLEGNGFLAALPVIGLARTGATVPHETLDALYTSRDAESGAFGTPAYGVTEDADSTALAAVGLALLTGDDTAQDRASEAVQWLVDNECTAVSDLCPTAGAYWGSYSPVNTSGLAIPVLSAAGEDVSDEVAWLLDQQNADGGFSGSGADSEVYATAQGLLGVTGQSLSTVSSADDDQAEASGAGNVWPWVGGLAVVVVIVGAVVLVRRRA